MVPDAAPAWLESPQANKATRLTNRSNPCRRRVIGQLNAAPPAHRRISGTSHQSRKLEAGHAYWLKGQFHQDSGPLAERALDLRTALSQPRPQPDSFQPDVLLRDVL
jgi:hypothetical protein